MKRIKLFFILAIALLFSACASSRIAYEINNSKDTGQSSITFNSNGRVIIDRVDFGIQMKNSTLVLAAGSYTIEILNNYNYYIGSEYAADSTTRFSMPYTLHSTLNKNEAANLVSEKRYLVTVKSPRLKWEGTLNRGFLVAGESGVRIEKDKYGRYHVYYNGLTVDESDNKTQAFLGETFLALDIGGNGGFGWTFPNELGFNGGFTLGPSLINGNFHMRLEAETMIGMGWGINSENKSSAFVLPASIGGNLEFYFPSGNKSWGLGIAGGMAYGLSFGQNFNKDLGGKSLAEAMTKTAGFQSPYIKIAYLFGSRDGRRLSLLYYPSGKYWHSKFGIMFDVST
ncbi:MAG: hypothetical protein LBM77_11960 [Spirochaetaceae bacterium]|jgi:hypothetical protein|nr:hypothetical protein [Spirochaetaceae bacterium]